MSEARAAAPAPLIDRIRELVLMRDHLDFVELDQLEGFRGNRPLLMEGSHFSGVCIWPNVSSAGIDAIVRLLTDGSAHLRPASPLVYVLAGVAPRMAVWRQVKRTQKLHWLPCVFSRGRPLPHDIAAGRALPAPIRIEVS